MNLPALALPLWTTITNASTTSNHNTTTKSTTRGLTSEGIKEAFTAVALWKERGLTLATKYYPIDPGLHKPEVLRENLEKSLKELKTDCVDIFHLHAADRSVPFEETLEECNKLHKEGKFVRLGLRSFTAVEVAEVAVTYMERG